MELGKNDLSVSSEKADCAPDARPVVSLVVPGYNEADIVENNLDVLCDYMETLEDRYSWELIFINDGSTDETGDLAETCSLSNDKIIVLHHPYNFRLGQALRYAFSQCSGDYVVVLDLDLSYSPEHIVKMLDKMIQSKAKIVIASPYMDGGRVDNVPWFRMILSKWANRYLCMTASRDKFSDRITTITGMVRAYDRRFLDKLNLKAMDVDINFEIIYKAMILRARIVEIPAHLNWSQNKSSKKAKRKSTLRISRSIVQSLISGFLFRPFMFFVIPGIFLMLLSFYPITWAFIHSAKHFQKLSAAELSFDYRLSDAIGMAFSQSPHSFVIGGFALMIGIQLFSLGVIALQKKRYFEELFHINSIMLDCSRNCQKRIAEKLMTL